MNEQTALEYHELDHVVVLYWTNCHDAELWCSMDLFLMGMEFASRAVGDRELQDELNLLKHIARGRV